MCEILNLRFPALLVVSGPELLGGIAGVGDLVFLGIEVDGFASAVGNAG